MTEPIQGYLKLKAWLVENNIKQTEVAELLQIGRSAFNSKLNRNNADFNLDEVRAICRKYNLDANKYFF